MTLEFRDKGKTKTQVAVMSGALQVCHISKDFYSITAGSSGYWRWNFQIGPAVPEGFLQHGTADTYEDARAAVERYWQMWLEAAGLDRPTAADR